MVSALVGLPVHRLRPIETEKLLLGHIRHGDEIVKPLQERGTRSPIKIAAKDPRSFRAGHGQGAASKRSALEIQADQSVKQPANREVSKALPAPSGASTAGEGTMGKQG